MDDSRVAFTTSRGRGKRLSPVFKACGALDAAKGQKTASEIAPEIQVHAVQIILLKRQLLDRLSDLFDSA